MWTGLSAFPLTPMHGHEVDEVAFAKLIQRLREAQVDSIGVLGSTGNYAYLSREQRQRVIEIALDHAGAVPVVAGIGALSTHHVLQLADDAQRAGVQGVLLAPMSYQKLTASEVLSLYTDVCSQLSVPLCVYDNPLTTHFEFSDELHGRIAHLPQVASIKIPPVPANPAAAKERITRLRALVPTHVTLGVSGDAAGAMGLTQGCDAWFSAIAGSLPALPLAITRAAQAGQAEQALALSASWQPLWDLFAAHGSLRVTATAAELLGLVRTPCLPPPLQALQGEPRERLAALLTKLEHIH
jgi:4-hydroxy-tetrahydrodipicolinate synthase